jgi:hypothetical protein
MTTVSALGVYLDVLFGRARASTLIEVRWRTTRGMGRRFVSVGDRITIAQLALRVAAWTDVYVGVLPRWRPAGGRAAVVGDGRTVWVDLDSDVAARALEPVEPAPSLVVASGGSGHLHAYWSLTAGVPPRMIERANRRLAWALGGDLHSADAARILRPPETVHHGRGTAPVRLVDGNGVPVRFGDLTAGLPDLPSGPAGAMRRRSQRRRGGDPLLELEPERYVAALTGRCVAQSRKVRCPLHDDRTASLHVYREPERGWYCFGCRRGGSVYDLAAALWHIEPRGAGFVAVRERLTAMFP